MTLVKEKPKRPSREHRQRKGHHHRQSRHYLKAYWPYLPVLGILSLGFAANIWMGQLRHSVLGYATDMSIQSLLDDTNAQRTQNSESSLTLNTALNQAAQAKANDMAARDYWSHNTPDGQTPWTFITAAGYKYATAGENLAYGFTTAAYTVDGWMNSPEHRANILNTSFHDVGFGIANIPDYQGSGPETLVVAMYGSTASAPAVAATTPAPTPTPKPTQAIPAPKPAPAPRQATPTSSEPAPLPITTTAPAKESPVVTIHKDTLEPKQQRVTQLQLVASNAPVSAAAVITLGFTAFAFLVLRHSLAWRKVLVHGEAFVLRHPLLDITAVTVTSLVIVLSNTAGLIR